MKQARSNKPLIFFIAVLILSIVAVFLFVNRCSSDKPSSGNTPGHHPSANSSKPSDSADNIAPDLGDENTDDPNTGYTGTPEELVKHISEITLRANESGDIQPLIDLLGQRNLSPTQVSHLRNLAAASQLKLDKNNPFSAINRKNNRWSLNLADQSRIYLDLSKTPDGQWQVNHITLPDGKRPIAENSSNPANPANPDEENKAATTVNNFLTSIINLDPASARKYIDPTKVSYARLAGLCIIFEEGKYRFIKDKPLRKMFLRNTSAGWLARLESPDTNSSAMFAINTKRKNAHSPWKITEINLDKLLTDYANRVSGGDIYYTPLIPNPKGGDSLVIYFDLDSDQLTSRSQRQLTIVANLLKTDKQKHLTISGYTDALGSDQYNLSLSKKRARQVMQFLADKGVPAAQISIAGFGKAKPRVPNTTEDGKDNPDGRRANRRAEIFLDF